MGHSPVGIEEPIINENQAMMLEERLVKVTQAAIKLNDIKEKMIDEVRKIQVESSKQLSLSLPNSRRNKRNSTGRGVKKSRKNNKKSRK
jgi:hypothetical protein